MFTNRKGCTTYEKITLNRSPTFVRHEIKNIYVEGVKSQKMSGSQGNGYMISQNQLLICIPETSLTDYLPKISDKIVVGIISDESPPDEAMTVMTVKDFRHGSPSVHHLEVTAE
ncbi:MAG: hypothetical protein K2J08_08365 [Ruminococcus sp.]|nr:hypothetical protein [Ruminococcus sp.]